MLLPKSPHDIHLEILREWFSGDDGFADYEAAAETLADQTDEQIADAIGGKERNNPDFDREATESPPEYAGRLPAILPDIV